MKHLAVILAAISLASCSQAIDQPYWSAHCDYLYQDTIAACYGPFMRTNDAYPFVHVPSNNIYLKYQVSVEHVTSHHFDKTLFFQEFDTGQVDPRLLVEDRAQVVKPNIPDHKITLILVEQVLTIRLPPQICPNYSFQRTAGRRLGSSKGR